MTGNHNALHNFNLVKPLLSLCEPGPKILKTLFQSDSKHARGHPLHPRMRGRGQRLAPATQEVEPPICKPSREGEVCLQSSLAGSAVRMWFKPLRRLQSLNHASKANKQTPSATCYRAELWSAILRAPGFHPSFQAWWKRRESPCDGAPKEFPQCPSWRT